MQAKKIRIMKNIRKKIPPADVFGLQNNQIIKNFMKLKETIHRARRKFFLSFSQKKNSRYSTDCQRGGKNKNIKDGHRSIAAALS